ncbi:MAG TPA: glycosyltransferase, partial [Acidimicrobiales bacterium]|nr:glycosyltransferase [Acidimicrobiales bacterium]
MSAAVVPQRQGGAPSATAVIPTCGRPTLIEAVRAALGQEGVEVAVVVVDDSGTGAVRAIGGPLADPRVRVVSHERRLGVARSRNDGI